MAFNPDYRLATEGSARLANATANLGQSIGGALSNAYQGYQQGQQQGQQQAQQQQQNILVNAALNGDQDALAQISQIDPNMGMQIQDRLSTQGVEADKATALSVLGAQERYQKLPPEQQAAYFDELVNNPNLDIDEEDREFFGDADVLRAGLTEYKGKEYADAFMGGDGKSKATNFAPQVSSIQTDPDSGQKYVTITDRNTGEVKRVDAKGAIGQTLEQEQDRQFRSESLKDARQVSKESFDQLKNIRASMGTIDEAISAIDDGAESGFVDKFFPSFTESSVALENAAQRMGLDVISATTFGALSEGELRLAMSTAMPQNMEPKQLRKWLVNRKKAQGKLAKELTKMAITLGKGKTTMAEYAEKNATFDYSNQQQPSQPQTVQQQQQQANMANLSDEDLFN